MNYNKNMCFYICLQRENIRKIQVKFLSARKSRSLMSKNIRNLKVW